MALISGVVIAQAAVAGPASAATPTCTKYVTYQSALLPAAPSGSVTCNLARGTNSDAVARLQDTLNDCYASRFESTSPALWPLVIDGDFGGNTEKALKQVQAAVGIDDDGQYGPITRTHIQHTKALYNASSPCKYVT